MKFVMFHRKIFFLLLFLYCSQALAVEGLWQYLWDTAKSRVQIQSELDKVLEEAQRVDYPVPLKPLVEASHCKGNENWVFNCLIKKKVLSICASKDLSEAQGYVQYHYGSIEKPELVFPRDKRHPVGIFNYSRTMYSGGGEYRLELSRKNYSYVVFSKTLKEEWHPNRALSHHSTAGVYVVKDNSIIATLACEPKENNLSEWGFDIDPFILEKGFYDYE